MLNVLKTLILGPNARAEERLTDHFAIDLVEQKIREAEHGLAGAKNTLASLIVRQRNEDRALTTLEARIADLEQRARLALTGGREDLAEDAAAAIADLENERNVRKATVAQLNDRIARTRSSVEKANSRIIDLRQGMISARAVDVERKAQKSLNRSLGSNAAVREAEDLIARIMNQGDPMEEGEVLDEIDADLSSTGIRDRLGEAGYGAKNRISADDVLARLKFTPSTVA